MIWPPTEVSAGLIRGPHVDSPPAIGKEKSGKPGISPCALSLLIDSLAGTGRYQEDPSLRPLLDAFVADFRPSSNPFFSATLKMTRLSS